MVGQFSGTKVKEILEASESFRKFHKVHAERERERESQSAITTIGKNKLRN